MTISQAVDPIVITRTLNATPAQVYHALTNPSAWSRWLSNAEHGYATSGENQTHLLTWQDGNYATIRVEKLEENSEVVWSWRANHQNEFSTVTFTLDEGDGVTNLTMQHDGVEAARDDYMQQWENALNVFVPLVETGEQIRITERVIIGIFPSGITQEEADELGVEVGNASKVNSLVAGFGAEKAGVQVDDIIVGIAGQRFTQDRTMVAISQEYKPGDEIEVELFRNGKNLKLTMPLSGYPVPPIGKNFNDLADIIEPQYKKIMQDIRGFFDGVSEAQANAHPAEGEWSAALTIAHLILSEPYYHNQLGGMIEGGAPRGWSGNNDTRLNAVLKRYPTTEALLNALEAALTETVDILRLMPEEVGEQAKQDVWNMSFALDGNVRHAHIHYAQIQAALEAAK